MIDEYSNQGEPKKHLLTPLILLTLIGLMAAAVALSVLVFSKTSLRLDEAQSLFQISRDTPGLLKLVAQDVHVPGYHLLLQLWTTVFGNDITTARYMSLVFFVLTIPFVYYLGAWLFNRRAGMFAAVLITISPFLEWYGSEARMYSMLALVTVIHQLIFMKLFRGGKPGWWVLFVFATIAGFYTHYFFSFVLLTEVFFYVLFRKQFPKKSFRKFVVSAVIAVATFSPWLLYVRSLGTASSTQPNLGTPTSGDLFNTYAQFIFGFQVDNLNTIIVSLWPVVVLLAFFALQRNRRTPPEAFFFTMAAVVPVIGAFVLSITVKPFYLSRYLIVALPALLILIAWGISLYSQKVRLLMQGILSLLIISLLYVQAVNPNTPVKEDYKGAVSYLSGHVSNSDVIVASAPFTIYPIEYYYKGAAKLTTQPIWNRFESGAVPGYDASSVKRETDTNVASYQNAWLVLSYNQGYNDKLKAYYDSRFQRLSMHTFSPGLVVYEYKVRYDPPVSLTSP